MIKVLYFASLRESLGSASESLEVQDGLSIADLMALLAARGGPWQQEFDGCKPLRAALNQILVANDALVRAGDEVAFFPPVTGG